MANRHEFISLTTIVTLLVIVVVEAAHNMLMEQRFFRITEMQLMVGAGLIAFLLFIVVFNTNLVKQKYYPIARLSAIILLALAVEAFANYVIVETGKWLALIVSLLVIYLLAWYGYVETHKLKAL